MTTIQAVLFDLDGTLLDTAQDMTFALNQLRLRDNLPALPLSVTRSVVGYGAKSLLKIGFNIDDNHPHYTRYLEDFLDLYHEHLAVETRLFPGMDKVLTHLESQQMAWGIVTNKPSRFTFDLLKKLQLDQRAACIICGDSLSTRKPHPEPILHACKLLNQEPENCLYVGDTLTDVTASKAAGTKSLVTLYGYIGEDEDPYTWQADGYVKHAIDVIEWLKLNG